MVFLFLAAASVALFAFLSIAAFAGTHAQERKERDRFALLKSLAEQPTESAQKVIDLLREQEEQARVKKEREERRGFLIGGLVLVAAGVGVLIMFLALAKEGLWTIGLIPVLVGVVLTSIGVFSRPGR
jgi:Flp pilus assembly protein TadB